MNRIIDIARCAELVDENNKKEPVIGSAIRKHQDEAMMHGEIIDYFIKQHLESRISCARWVLALAIAMTALFRGAIALWIVFILIYRTEVNRYKKEAIEAQKRKWKK